MTLENMRCKICGEKFRAHRYQLPRMARKHLKEEHGQQGTNLLKVEQKLINLKKKIGLNMKAELF